MDSEIPEAVHFYPEAIFFLYDYGYFQEQSNCNLLIWERPFKTSTIFPLFFDPFLPAVFTIVMSPILGQFWTISP